MNDDAQAIPFAIVPSEAVMDTRLTLESLRVLVTLYSFRNKNTGLAFPSREAISKRCGLHPSNISDATTKLIELGWIVKDGSGGHSKATRYTINIPDAVTQLAALHKERSQARKDKKVAQSAIHKVAESAIHKVAESATPPVAQSATRIEQTNITNKGTDHIANLLDGVNEQIVKDFLQIRKSKKSPLTDTALNGIQREADKANISLEAALQICCERNWVGFKAEWIAEKKDVNKQEQLEESNRKATHGWIPPELRS